ncbi:hypothetical protein QBC40DRAFT_232197 [Triangularia verruculosa]|uniref:DUF2423 domain-containing protein n=1 Tax=Triangularia verruculosa TaxID=2587418 RepID=A0AAN7AQJ7_9PEZI|nr:hypothetical protein QBC40DRAFT_232197 [Triangularia verruculosa]
MGKSSRASTIKANNRRLKANVFGPVEAARAARLHAKLAEVIAQPKPVKEVEMDDEPAEAAKEAETVEDESATMEVDEKPAAPYKEKERKRRGKKSNIVFRKKGPKTNSKKK